MNDNIYMQLISSCFKHIKSGDLDHKAFMVLVDELVKIYDKE